MRCNKEGFPSYLQLVKGKRSIFSRFLLFIDRMGASVYKNSDSPAARDLAWPDLAPFVMIGDVAREEHFLTVQIQANLARP